jgi:hypothetical protein
MTASANPGPFLLNSFIDLVTTGLDANKPAAPLIDNAHTLFYYATDTQILYHWDPSASAWRGTSISGPSIAVGAAATAKAGVNGLNYRLDTAAGSVLTLPAAKGTGLTLSAYVKTTATSNAHKILTSPITDVLIGAATGSAAAGVVKMFFGAVASGFHSIQMPFAGTQPSGGFEGDIFNFTDVESGKWLVEAMYQAGTTATTPFSTATT